MLDVVPHRDRIECSRPVLEIGELCLLNVERKLAPCVRRHSRRKLDPSDSPSTASRFVEKKARGTADV